MKQNNEKELILNIKVQANSKKNSIVGKYGENIKIKISVPAVDNKANKELKKFLSSELKIRKKNITILKGEHSSLKIVKILFDKLCEKNIILKLKL